mgnify:CR=1 FL=1|tara:strand:+ start:312 stop:749 length:438 start_codon:yes stop_codon:yes gene_type:complete
MPKLIFSKNNDVTKGNLFRIAKDQSHLDNNADWNQEDYSIVEISQSDFDAVRLISKSVIYDGTNVTYEDMPQDQWDQDHASNKEHVVNILNKWLEENSSKPFASNVTSYRDYLVSLDASTIPVREGFEQWINDQGQEVINPLELV